jgi:hypothetical protein
MPELPPALTLEAFYRLPTRSSVEVYVPGTGMWVPGFVFHGNQWSTVYPDDFDLRDLCTVKFLDVDLHANLERKLLLIRLPHPKGRRVESSGQYRAVLDTMAGALLDLMLAERHPDSPSFTEASLTAASRHLLSPAGGLVEDLWEVMKSRIKSRYVPPEDDLLAGILEEIEKG